jgi:hypothetical protein
MCLLVSLAFTFHYIYCALSVFELSTKDFVYASILACIQFIVAIPGPRIAYA